MMAEHYMSRKRLEEIKRNLGVRDFEILHLLSKYRYLTTEQARRFCWTDSTSKTAALRSAHRALGKLRDLTLITPLERRIGGVRGGSSAFVWSLQHNGARLLRNSDDAEAPRKRHFEPSLSFLSHTLTVAEVALCLTEARRRNVIADLDIECEPGSWRPYVAPGGATARIKPDLAVVTTTEEFEDRWFFEVDLATEPPSRIINTCHRYADYHRSGEEQKRYGVFPAVVWVVPIEARRAVLATRIVEELGRNSVLFAVITLDKLEKLVTFGLSDMARTDEGPLGDHHA